MRFPDHVPDVSAALPPPGVGRTRRYPQGVASRRKDLGSWLEGTPGGSAESGRLGLPATGRGSPAGLPRRLIGVAVDWLLSLAVSSVLFPADDARAMGLLAGAPLALSLIH